MKKIKVVTIAGTRPEIIKLSRVIYKLDLYTEHVLVHTGQNYDYELNEIFFDELGIRKPDHFLDVANVTVHGAIADVIQKSGDLLHKIKPDAILILGDTNSCLSVIAAKRQKIPIFHMEAGNRCFDQRVPEEINRKLIDHCSDINLPYSDIARNYLLNEGLPADQIIKTGSPMLEVLDYHKDKINASDVLQRLSLTDGEYIIVSAHREENVDDQKRLRSLVDLLQILHDKYNKRIIFSTHPRTRMRLDKLGLDSVNGIEFIKPLGFIDYIALQKHAYVVLSDSGTITEESSILKFRAITIRDAHERPEGMEEAAVPMISIDPDRIVQAIELLHGSDPADLKIVDDYQVNNVSEKIVRIILSYTDYINRNTWKR